MMTSSSGFGGQNDAGARPTVFDTWLQTQLQRLYDQTLEEAVPEDLLQLLSEAEQRGH